MKKRGSAILIAALLLYGAVSVYGQKADDIGEPINRVLKEYDDAWNKKNVAGVSVILADEYVYFSSTGGLTDRRATLDFLGSPDYKLTFVERSEIRLLSKSDVIAVVSSRWKGRGTFGKEAIDDDQRCGLVFVKHGKVWKLLTEHCTQIVTK